MNKLNTMTRFKWLGIGTAEVLLPDHAEFPTWAVLACDQHTSDPAYWEKVKKTVGDAPSTLNMVYPEAQLKEDDAAAREAKIEDIAKTSKEYYHSLFEEETEKGSDGFFYVKRETSTGTRHGILMCLDLAEVGEDGRFRPSEAVIDDKLAVRKKIREQATLEMPHIIMLANDKENLLFQEIDGFTRYGKAYDFDLMEGGGHIEGYLMAGELVHTVGNAVKELEKQDGPTLIVGDGNHALMAAKKHYDEMVAEFDVELLKDHPLRYCMVEVVNLYDDAIQLLPIHRVVMGANKADIEAIAKKAGGSVADGGNISVIAGGESFTIQCEDMYALERALEESGKQVEYIHDENRAKELGKDGATLIMPVIAKEDLFPAVEKNGVLPKKSFSIGKAQDKRYYLESRRITM